MINKVLIAFNNAPEEENSFFFTDCADIARQISSDVKISYDYIEFDRLNHADLQSIVYTVEGDYIFVAASHGTTTSLVNAKSEEYLSKTVNEYLFNGNIVYSLACSCGDDLADYLIQTGTRVFWGYKAQHQFTFGESAFAECALEGLKYLIKGANVEEALEKAYEKYDDKIDELYLSNPIAVAKLLANKKGLVAKYSKN